MALDTVVFYTLSPLAAVGEREILQRLIFLPAGAKAPWGWEARGGGETVGTMHMVVIIIHALGFDTLTQTPPPSPLFSLYGAVFVCFILVSFK